ncbi:hypothetical protein N7539_000507 [Penicillium diatomitis]|uniref:Uncharacterized protein n=1 Tax=Penicillium diatomitis TaxID=2819901 RepID=A0A9W9XLV9_9EURO|nr:uncharacterized protein N7539_000507 [Penicillium diatomitis]KAJ5495391.1 hypothetical protein N7539_000507 [Penicillium diatomitis]
MRGFPSRTLPPQLRKVDRPVSIPSRARDRLWLGNAPSITRRYRYVRMVKYLLSKDEQATRIETKVMGSAKKAPAPGDLVGRASFHLRLVCFIYMIE